MTQYNIFRQIMTSSGDTIDCVLQTNLKLNYKFVNYTQLIVSPDGGIICRNIY
jgi:hypothetical protein